MKGQHLLLSILALLVVNSSITFTTFASSPLTVTDQLHFTSCGHTYNAGTSSAYHNSVVTTVQPTPTSYTRIAWNFVPNILVGTLFGCENGSFSGLTGTLTDVTQNWESFLLNVNSGNSVQSGSLYPIVGHTINTGDEIVISYSVHYEAYVIFPYQSPYEAVQCFEVGTPSQVCVQIS